MKKVLLAGVVLAVIAVIAFVVVGSNAGKLVKAAIEQFAPKFTGTSVTVGSVDLSPTSGSGAVKNLVVGNPEGYSTPFAIRLGSASLAVDPASILKDKVVVRSIQVTDPEINIEGGLTDNNLKKIMANLDSFTAGEKGKPAEETGAKKKLQIDEFVLTGAKVNVKFKLLPGGATSINLPEIRLFKLGTGPDGITPAAVAKEVIGEVVSKTMVAVTSLVGDLGKGATDAAKGAAKGATDAAKGVLDGAKGLFKK